MVVAMFWYRITNSSTRIFHISFISWDNMPMEMVNCSSCCFSFVSTKVVPIRFFIYKRMFQCKNLGILVLVDDHGKYIQKVRRAGFSAIHFGVDVPNWEVAIMQIREFDS